MNTMAMGMAVGTIIDTVMFLVFAYFLYKGVMRGFSGEVIGLVGIGTATFCAFHFNEPATELAIHMLFNDSLTIDRGIISIICMVLIFFIVEMLFAGVGAILTYMVKVTDLTVTDRMMGVVIAALKTCFIIVAVFAAASPFLSDNWYEGSYTMTFASKVWPYVRDILEQYGLLDLGKLTGK